MSAFVNSKSSPSAAIRAGLDYPVIDTDVHTNDYSPALEDYVTNYGGAHLVDELRKASADRIERGGISNGKNWYEQTAEERSYYRSIRAPWWARVTKNTLDVATYHLPELLYQRQAEQGSDFSLLFPNNVLAPLGVKAADSRRALQRAVNHYHADLYKKYSDRLTPVAGIALNTPEEGIAELEFAVKTLGLKAINIAGSVRRPIRALAEKFPADKYPELQKYISYQDFYGLDSEYDYDPFWAKVVELGVPVLTHYGSQGWTGRSSISNYMFNHIGHFADGSEAFAKALFFGGVTRRFPKLRVGLLEGGADWGARVYIHLVDRWVKRGREGLRNYDPAATDCAAHAAASLLRAFWRRAQRRPPHRRREFDPRYARPAVHERRAPTQARRARGLRARGHRERGGHQGTLGRQLLLRVGVGRPHGGACVQRQGQPPRRQDQRHLLVRRGALGRA